VIASIGWVVKQRTTAYDTPPKQQMVRFYQVTALLPVVKTPPPPQYAR
jgi:hypothetical protein